MSTDEFITKLEEAIEGTEPGTLSVGTEFKSLPQWDSLAALSTVGMISSEFDIEITADELKNSISVGDLYKIVASKIKS